MYCSGDAIPSGCDERAKMVTYYWPPPPMIGGIFMCLYVILLVKRLTIGYQEGKKKVCCKTFLYCKREMNMSWKLLFCALKINDLIITLFHYLYLLSICVYICVSWIFTYMVYVYVFSSFPCYFLDWKWLCHYVYIPY